MEEEGGGGGGPPPPLWPPSLHGRWPWGHTRRCTPPRTTERSNGRSAAGAETRGDSGELRAPSSPSPLSPRGQSRRRAEGIVEEEEEVGFTVPRGRSARQYAVRGPCGDFTTDRSLLLSSSPPLILFPLFSFLFLAVYPPFLVSSAFSPLVFVLGFSTRILVSQFLNKKTIRGGYILLLSGGAEWSLIVSLSY